MRSSFNFQAVNEQMISDRISSLFGTAKMIVSNVFGQKRKKLVMVVERDSATLRLINKLIKKLNSQCELVHIPDGAEAFATVCSRPPDVIVANSDLYGINGFRFVDNLKMDFHAKRIPLILTTGLTSAALITHLLVNLRGGFPQGAMG
jgi:CheY-like chemotaxis protein